MAPFYSGIHSGCLNAAELASAMDVQLKNLDSEIRKHLILKGDDECYNKAKKASDGLEHGFLGFSEIRDYATDVRHRMATYIRQAILELSGVSDELLAELTTDPYDKPLGHWPLAKYLRGKLVGESEVLPREGNFYPVMRWATSVKACTPEATGKLKFEITENITPELADGILFQGQSIEVWGAS